DDAIINRAVTHVADDPDPPFALVPREQREPPPDHTMVACPAEGAKYYVRLGPDSFRRRFGFAGLLHIASARSKTRNQADRDIVERSSRPTSIDSHPAFHD